MTDENITAGLAGLCVTERAEWGLGTTSYPHPHPIPVLKSSQFGKYYMLYNALYPSWFPGKTNKK